MINSVLRQVATAAPTMRRTAARFIRTDRFIHVLTQLDF
jgi:hypothetical protein